MAPSMPVVALLLVVAARSESVAPESDCPATEGGCAWEAEKDAPVNLMQLTVATKTGARRTVEGSVTASTDDTVHSTCTTLGNHGSWFSVPVQIGTPPQLFDVVADTGSNALLVPDCRCVTDGGGCTAGDACFNAQKSKSFNMTATLIKAGKDKGDLAVRAGIMSYGSGNIAVVVASDLVTVAGVKTMMHNGLNLIENRNQLKVSSDFDGILGLGLPTPIIKQPMFTTVSGIQKYKICFGEKAGALHLNVASLPKPMSNIGQIHWGLDLQGFTIGDASTPAQFCTPASKKPGQKTACAAIPDSGTTLMMGPPAQIKMIFASLCDKWSRCGGHAKEEAEQKAMRFHNILQSCDSWLTKDTKLDDELPSLFVHVAGGQGEPQKAEIKPSAFVIESTEEVYAIIKGKLFGRIPVETIVDTGKQRRVCMPAFGARESVVPAFGPVWIIGMPLFSSATVGYDLADGGSISLEQGPCTSCEKPLELVSSRGAEHTASAGEAHRPALRRVEKIREPSFGEDEPF